MDQELVGNVIQSSFSISSFIYVALASLSFGLFQKW